MISHLTPMEDQNFVERKTKFIGRQMHIEATR